MSLTSELARPGSPIRTHIRDRFPNTRAVITPANRQLRKETTTTQPPKSAPHSLIGSAIDYRIRYMFANPAPYWRLVAHLGWQAIQEAAIIVNPPRPAQAGTIYARVPEAGPGRLAVSAVDRFFTDTHQFIRDARPSAHTLTARQEHELSARCIIMAVFEQSARTSPYRSGLLHSTDIHHTEDLFRLIRQPWIDDVTALARNAATVLDSQTDRPHTPNPTFDGSPDVGGADADIIIDTCLIDIKTTINPALKGEWLHQILSYTLLDYSNQHRIDRVAVLMPRQSTMPTWPISQFMDTLSNHRAQDLSHERRALRNILQKTIPPPLSPIHHPDRPVCNCAASLYDQMEHFPPCPSTTTNPHSPQ